MKSPDRRLGLAVIDAGHVVYPRDGGIIPRYAVDLVLDLPHVVAERTEPKRSPGVRLRPVLQGRVGDYLDIVAVVVFQYLRRIEPVIRELYRPPLRKSVALGTYPVTEHCEQRLDRARPTDIVVEYFVDDDADGVEYLSVLGIGVVIARVARDVEIVPAAAIKLGVHAVEGIGYLGEDVGSYARLRPCGEDLAGSDVLDIIVEGHGDVLGGLVGSAEMHGYICRYSRQQYGHHPSSPVSGVREIGRMVSILSCISTLQSVIS